MDPLKRIIEETQKGSNQAFEKIFQMYGSTVYAVCLRYTQDQADAKDLLQEVFIKVFQRIKDYRFEGSFEGWLKKIATHSALDQLRKNEKRLFQQKIEDIAGNKHPISSDDILGQVSVNELLELVKQLPTACRFVFNMYVIDGYKHQEIAEILGISEGTSKSNLHDARKILQNKIKTIMYEKNDY